MLRYLTNAISNALGFSKTESRGTLVLIFIIFSAISISNFRISYLKNQSFAETDSTAIHWIKKVQASYDIKETPKQEFDKSVFFPVKATYKKEKYATVERSESRTFKELETKIVIADLNTATPDQLQTVRGIGPAFSERITKYRDLLGGFADTTQLKEVYGLKKETILELLKQFQLKSPVSTININTDSIKLLASHPYISYDLARIIINYRKLHGDLKSSEDLHKIKAIDDRTFLRLKPYLEDGYAKNP